MDEASSTLLDYARILINQGRCAQLYLGANNPIEVTRVHEAEDLWAGVITCQVKGGSALMINPAALSAVGEGDWLD